MFYVVMQFTSKQNNKQRSPELRMMMDQFIYEVFFTCSELIDQFSHTLI